MSFNKNNLREGMVVRSADGDKLGKITHLSDEGITIEKGIFFPKDYSAHFDQINSVSDNDVYLKWRTDLAESKYDALYGTGRYSEETADKSMWADFKRPQAQQAEGLQHITLTEEELIAEKRGMREIGRVKVYKTVKMEDRTFTVAVRREEVHVERSPVTGSTVIASELPSFKDEMITIPIMEEEVEISKHPVVREELHIAKTVSEVDKVIKGTIRKEEARVERELDIEEGMPEKLKRKAA